MLQSNWLKAKKRRFQIPLNEHSVSNIDFDSFCPSRRTDLIIVQRESDVPTWVVKDPVQLNYYIFDEMQYWLFERLNGLNSVAAIAKKFDACFAPLRSTAEEIYGFCLQMSKDSLLNEVVSGEQISNRVAAKNKGRLLKLMMGVLSIKLPSINARGLFDVGEILFSWVFSRFAVLASFLLIGAAIFTAVNNFHSFVAELPFLESVTAQDIFSFLLALSFVKICHELGHAICCRRMGAECNEMGLMFLVFSPCLYCTVTDSWILTSKWKRIAVAAAGIYVELIIAAIMLICWNYCEQPVMRAFFLNVVLICSISTLLVNGNPLMRYDGYFILSDLSDIPNLANEARITSWSLIASLLFRSPARENRFYTLGQKCFLFGYYILSAAYRWLIMIAIFWLAYGKLKSVGLSTFAISMSVIYGTMMIAMFVVGFATFMYRKSKKEPVRWLGVLLFLGLVFAAGYFVAQVKIDHRIGVEAVIEFEDYDYCSSTTEGRLVYAIEPGVVVKKGDLIARLENERFEKEYRELTHEKKMNQIRIEHLETKESTATESQFQLPELRARLTDLETQIASAKKRLGRLDVLSPVAGRVVELEDRLPDQSRSELPKHSGSVLQPKNLGCYVETGELLCLVCKTDGYAVYLLVDERKLDLVDVGNRIELFFPTLEPQRFSGKVVGFAKGGVKTNPKEQAGVTVESPSISVRAVVELDEPIPFGFHNAVGKARITIQKETVGDIVKRFLIESFRFDL